MKKIYTLLLNVVLTTALVSAQQLPNPSFEDWSGAKFNGNIQPASWNACNVSQAGFDFNFAHREAGHTGSYSMMVQDQEVGAMGIVETSPGYFTLGTPWVYLPSVMQKDKATAGTRGGINWTYRPDSMSVWIKRTGDNVTKENFYLVFYSWAGTAQADSYGGKDGSCTSVNVTDEESDIRLATNPNNCGTDTKAQPGQIAEAVYFEKKLYSNWTKMTLPIYYLKDDKPQKMNIIFSAGRYPELRASTGLYAGNSLYVDDVELIYTSKIDQLVVGNKVWAGFDPESSEEQVYSLGENATEMPSIVARRGVGSITNAAGTVANFPGRVLGSDEMTVTPGAIDGAPTVITVTAEDGSSTHTYRIKFVRAASTNCNLASISVNGNNINGFSANNPSYNVKLPYGTTTAPVVDAVPADPAATYVVTQASSVTASATILVTAASGAQKTYTVNFSVALLADNRLADIKINGNSLPGFSPDKFIYKKVSLPLSTTTMPTVEAVQMYPGQQTVVHTAPAEIDGGTYQLAVTTPGNVIANVYKLTFKKEVSSYSLLSDLRMEIGGTNYVQDFDPNQMTYRVALPMGTTTMPTITPVLGDEYQTVDIQSGGLDGTTLVTVTAANGDQSIYKLIVSTAKSEISTLSALGYILDPAQPTDTTWIDGFVGSTTTYNVSLPLGTDPSFIPEVVYHKGDEYENVTVVSGSTTKVNVVAGNGNSTLYLVKFGVNMSTVNTLQMIYLDGVELENFNAEVMEYSVRLPKGTTAAPVVTYTSGDEYETITLRTPASVNGDAKIIVRPQSGVSRTYTIHFSVEVDENNNLASLLVGGEEYLDKLNEDLKDTIILPIGTTSIPTIVATAASEEANVQKTTKGKVVTITVTAASGAEKVYELLFVVQVSDNAYLQALYLDNVLLQGFRSDSLGTYEVEMPDNATPCPAITYVKGDPSQQVIVVAPATTGIAQVSVIPQGADAGNTYLINFKAPGGSSSEGGSGTEAPGVDFIEPSIVVPNCPIDNYSYVDTHVKSNKTALLGLEYLDYEKGISTETLGFSATQTIYHKTLDAGALLPDLHVYKDEGQTVLVSEPSVDKQRVMVLAENGDTTSYIIEYARIQSDNAFLSAILIDGDTIEGWNPSTFAYVDSLAWRTRVIPVVYPVAGTPAQTITTKYSKVNGVTTIHVVAPNGVAYKDYSIAFPVHQSSNTALESMYFDGDADVNFRPNILEYNVQLPYGDTLVPPIVYTKAEVEQRVEYIARPLGDTTKLVVTAENGDTRTYRFYVHAEEPYGDNRLSMIRIVELERELSLKDKAQRNFEVEMPYGSRTLTVEYEKNYEEQTVIVQNGGVNDTTKLIVLSNKESAENTIYNIIPSVPTADPATLTDILVDGTTIDGFDPEVFDYIVKVTSKPKLKYVSTKGADVNIVTQSTKHWEAEVSYGSRTNTYNVWFYYVNEQVPNMDFTEWTDMTVFTSAKKPTGWNVVGDALGKHSGWGTYSPGTDNIAGNGTSAVELISDYSSPGGGIIPAFITLGDVSSEGWKLNGRTTFEINGGIAFHNSPDELQVNYKMPTQSNNNIIQYMLTGSEGYAEHTWTNSNTFNDYRTFTFNLRELNNAVGEPTMLNITICSHYHTNSNQSTPFVKVGDMYVDWLKLNYNHTLTGVKVNGGDAAFDGTTAFTYDYPADSSEYIERPILSFTGEVNDQAPLVTWSTPSIIGSYEVRNANIRNFAENGTDYTDYTLQVRRPLDTNNELDSILVDSVNIYQAGVNSYVIPISRTAQLPDLRPFPASSRQNVKTTVNGDVVTITVTPEKGEVRVITITFDRQISSSTALKSLTAMVGEDVLSTNVPFSAEQHAYTVSTLTFPVIAFEKFFDGQTVDMVEGKHQITLTVTAEDGTVGEPYIVTVDDSQTTSGLLSEMTLNGADMATFDPATTEYDIAQPTWVGVKRAFDRDSVALIQEFGKETWKVYDNALAEHAYILNYGTAPDNDATLKAIYVGNDAIENWNASNVNYTVATDTAINLVVLKNSADQTLDITYADSLYTVLVTAADSSTTKTYSIKITPNLSDVVLLNNIAVEGYDIHFNPDELTYQLTLAAPSAKLQETPIPCITYEVGQEGQTVVAELGAVGEETYLNVTAEDGIATRRYAIKIDAEPSHNANLDMIYVNGWRVDTLFESGRHYYSKRIAAETVQIEYLKQDKFQTVTVTEVEAAGETGHYTEKLHVLAEDGVTYSDYIVEVYLETMSNIATLDNILLNGAAMSEYNVEQNPELTFDPGDNNYVIYMPQGTTSIPEVGTVLTAPVKSVDIQKDANDVDIVVTAKDEVHTNTYHLSFREKQSANAYLDSITYTFKNASGFWEEKAVRNFNKETYFYTETLPQEVRGVQKLTWKNGDEWQTVESIIEPVGVDAVKATIDVMAGDGVTSKQYVVFFQFTYATETYLSEINANLVRLENYDMTVRNYEIQLAPGTANHPELGFEKFRESQKVVIDTIQNVENKMVRQLRVTAESGDYGIYTVTTEIQKYADNQLTMIYVGVDSLKGFTPEGTEFYHTLPYGTTMLPIVKYEADETETVSSSYMIDTTAHSLGQMVQLEVTAQNGAKHTYLIHFPIAYNDDATLAMITLNENQLLPGFNDNLLNYKVVLGMTEALPSVVGVLKDENTQSLEYQTIGDPLNFEDTTYVVLKVTAEDQVTSKEYRIMFTHEKSKNAFLADLLVSGVEEDIAFSPDLFRYDFTIPFGQDTMPLVSAILAEEGQWVNENWSDTIWADDHTAQLSLELDVYSPSCADDPAFCEDFNVYQLIFTLGKDPDNALSAILLNGDTIEGFDPEQTEYTIAFEAGSADEDKYPLEAFTAIARSEQAEVTTSMQDGGTVLISVQAGNGDVRMYVITQEIVLSSENRLSAILVGEEGLVDFDPNMDYSTMEHQYIYWLPTGGSAPVITPVPMSDRAEVANPLINPVQDEDGQMLGYEAIIICTSEAGEDREYRVFMPYDTINDAAAVKTTDCLVKVIPGGKLLVGTIRKNVKFYVYNVNGYGSGTYELTPCDANHREVVILANGDEELVDFWGNNGTEVQLKPGTVYVYSFFEGDTKVLKTGKIITMP